uniref:Phosphoprotein ECPP44 n=1 Tax=Daucus carota TaxID=4039 RepID=ECP44_DAUCA|nr:RecName: Full=Phosphoprotein ECPP44 [Daucus carota]BAA82445.1 ecpp44 [Daucus carota]
MASDDSVPQHSVEKTTEYESSDRGLFDFMKKEEKDETKVIATEFEEKVQVSEPEPKYEDCKVVEEEEEKAAKPSLLEKLHRSGSSSSSSSSDEEVEEGGEKKKKKEKKGLKEKIEEKIHHKEEDTSVPVEVVTEPEKKKGFMEKIKEKLPGGGKKVEEETVAPPPPPAAAPVDCAVEGDPAKKGILEKIKEKIPGYHPKTSTEEEKKDNDCASAKLIIRCLDRMFDYYYYASFSCGVGLILCFDPLLWGPLISFGTSG